MCKMLLLPAMVVALMLLARTPLAAQELEGRLPLSTEPATDPAYSYSQPSYPAPKSYQPDSLALIHQRAQQYGAQRQARLAAMNWYGMSNSRPTASPTPFATMYSPAWQTPGHRPYAWHMTSWPVFPLGGYRR
jgi:hypothetical protein